ncbi:transmembrane 220 family protein [Alteromonadaceae bacterium BrNp21-10]|nr:transmembrane 220 family protein [Alteromonadaceae bacterium BrNp21-10]
MNRSLLRKTLLLLGGVVFFVFALLQINDASQYGNYDAWAWIGLYGITSGISFWMLRKSISASWLTAWTGFSAGSLFFRLQDDFGNFHFSRLDFSTLWNEQQTQMIQNTNESGGLLIMLIWCLVLLRVNRQRSI